MQAVGALTRVYTNGATLDQVLDAETTPMVRELVAGTLRHHFSLTWAIEQKLTRPLRRKDTDVKALLLLGAYQLLHMRTPAHAAVAETVHCANALKKSWAKGLVNAVLRNLPSIPPLTGSQGAELQGAESQAAELSQEARFEHPGWFITALQHDLPDHWEAVLHANNTRAPMSLRVNSRRTSTTEYCQRLTSAGIAFELGALAETINLRTPQVQTSLPDYDAGFVAVQDTSAQLAAALTKPTAGARVLDACAAPGGKGFHLLERYPSIHLQMQDNAPARVATLISQAERLGHIDTATAATATGSQSLTIIKADSTAPGPADEQPWDLILLDAPCSGSGTVRRHPDIKVLREPASITDQGHTQSALLDALWRRLAQGGRLVYSTCSLFREENDAIISAFLSRQATMANSTTPEVDLDVIANELPVHASRQGVQTQFGWQTLPTDGGGDGLYYCVLKNTLKPAIRNLSEAEQ